MPSGKTDTKQRIDKALIFLQGISVTLCVYHILTLHLHHINRNLLLSHAEDFKVGDHTLKKIDKYIYHLIFTSKVSAVCPLFQNMYLRSLRSPIHFHTQVISISLPVQFAVDNVEEVADTDLLTGRHLHQSHSGWDVFVLRNPECYDVVTRRPWEVPVDTKHRFSFISLQSCHNLKHATTINNITKARTLTWSR